MTDGYFAYYLPKYIKVPQVTLPDSKRVISINSIISRMENVIGKTFVLQGEVMKTMQKTMVHGENGYSLKDKTGEISINVSRFYAPKVGWNIRTKVTAIPVNTKEFGIIPMFIEDARVVLIPNLKSNDVLVAHLYQRWKDFICTLASLNKDSKLSWTDIERFYHKSIDDREKKSKITYRTWANHHHLGSSVSKTNIEIRSDQLEGTVLSHIHAKLDNREWKALSINLWRYDNGEWYLIHDISNK